VLTKELLKNPLVRAGLIFLAGAIVGVLFYPSKRIEEKVSAHYEQEIAKLKETHAISLKQEKETYDKERQQLKARTEEYERKVSKLTSELKEANSKTKTAYYKIVRPDGTIEIKKFSESEVHESSKVITQVQEEFKSKVTEIEQKWEKIHKERVVSIASEFRQKEQQYEKQIADLQKSKVTEVNQKRFGAEIGVMQDKNYYGHATGDLFGPIFLGVHGEVGRDNSSQLGVGVGIRF
jgi:hypothetical protein